MFLNCKVKRVSVIKNIKTESHEMLLCIYFMCHVNMVFVYARGSKTILQYPQRCMNYVRGLPVSVLVDLWHVVCYTQYIHMEEPYSSGNNEYE